MNTLSRQQPLPLPLPSIEMRAPWPCSKPVNALLVNWVNSIYVVSPTGQATTVFTSTGVGKASILFENLAHGFSQRVSCERKGAALQSWIEGPVNGQLRRIEYAYQRVPCTPG